MRSVPRRPSYHTVPTYDFHSTLTNALIIYGTSSNVKPTCLPLDQTTSNMSTSSLAAVASRINERNNALRSELTTLELLRSEEEELGKVLLAEEKSTREVRGRATASSLCRKRINHSV